MATKSIYELPTSSRIKHFLVFERISQRIATLKDQAPPWGLHAAVTALLELERITSKGNLRSELIKELHYQISSLEKLSQSSGVDRELLENIVDQQRRLIGRLETGDKTFEQSLKENELLGQQRRRFGFHANSHDYDSPAYQHMLARSINEQRAILDSWMQAFATLSQAIEVVLGLIRSSASPVSELAYQGYFQTRLDGEKKCQLLRIGLPESSPYYPDVSLGRSKLSLRFLEPTDQYEHALQIEEDIEFQLTRCAL